MLSGQVAERMKRLQRRGCEPQDARPVYALAAWAQRMTTMLQAGTDANTRAGRSILTGYPPRGISFNGITIPASTSL